MARLTEPFNVRSCEWCAAFCKVNFVVDVDAEGVVAASADGLLEQDAAA